MPLQASINCGAGMTLSVGAASLAMFRLIPSVRVLVRSSFQGIRVLLDCYTRALRFIYRTIAVAEIIAMTESMMHSCFMAVRKYIPILGFYSSYTKHQIPRQLSKHE